MSSFVAWNFLFLDDNFSNFHNFHAIILYISWSVIKPIILKNFDPE